MREDKSIATGVGPFRFESEIGSGASGVVYRAVDGGGRRVAVKLLHAHLDDPELRERFRREAQIHVEHPNVVRVLDAGVEADRPYIVFELLEGQSLEKRLESGPLQPAEAVRLLRQACAGLAAAHANGVIHRDLKPANLFLTREGDLKILDFGVALATARHTRVTQAATIMGTPAYLSPEQARALRDLDARTDVWALGAILYEMLCARLAFGRDTMFATLVAIRKEEPIPLAVLAPHVPPALVAIVERALAKAREDRWQSVAELDAALAEVMASPVRGASTGDGDVAERAEARVLAVLLATGVSDAPELRRLVEAQGGVLHILRGARALGIFGRDAWVGDEVSRAVRAALDARASAEFMAVSSGQATLVGSRIAGALIDAVERGCAAGLQGLAIDDASARDIADGLSLRPHGDGISEVRARRLPTRFISTPRLMGISEVVGRERELESIRQGLERVMRQGRAATVILHGPPGIGKTRLCQHAEQLARVMAEACDVTSVRAEWHQRAAPLALIKNLVRERLRPFVSGGRSFGELTPDERRATIGDLVRATATPIIDADACRDALCRLLGVDARDATPHTTMRRASSEVHQSIRAAVLDHLGSVLTRRALVVIIEELQWADALSLDLLSEIRLRNTHKPLFLMLTGRQLTANHGELFGAAPQQLDGLAPGEVARLVQQTIGHRLPEPMVRQLTQQTAGNPLFVEQIARALDEQRDAVASMGDLPLPLSVRAAVQSRFDQLDAEDKSLCKSAAILERAFYADELEALGHADAMPRLATLTTRGILTSHGRTDPMRGRMFRFQGQVMEEVAQGMLAPEQRRALHRRVAQHLAREDHAGELAHEEIARHFEAGAMPEEAARHYALGALSAARAGDAATVLRCAERALDLGAAPEDLCALHCARAEALGLVGRRDEQRDALEDALASAASVDERARVMGDLAAWYIEQGDHARALELARRAETQARAAGDDVALALALGRQVEVLAHAGELAEAEQLLLEAQALAATSAPAVRAQVAAWRGELAAAKGDLGERRLAAYDAVTAYAQAGDVARAASAAVGLAEVHLRFGLIAEAADELQVAIHDCRSAAHLRLEARAWALLGWALALLGRADEAHHALDEASRLSESLGDERLGLLARVHRLCVEHAHDDPHARASDGEAAAALAATLGEHALQVLALARASQAWLAAGHGARAVRAAEDALAARDAGGATDDDVEVFLALAEALDAVGEPVRSDEVRAAGLARVEALAARIDDPLWRQGFLDDGPGHRRLRLESP